MKFAPDGAAYAIEGPRAVPQHDSFEPGKFAEAPRKRPKLAELALAAGCDPNDVGLVPARRARRLWARIRILFHIKRFF